MQQRTSRVSARLAEAESARSATASAKARRDPSARKTILLALDEDFCPQNTVWRSLAFARLLDAELHVLRVLDQPVRRRLLSPRITASQAIQALVAVLEARRATRTNLADSLGLTLPRGRLSVRHGHFFQQVRTHARELGALLIVLPSRAACWPAQVSRLARSTSIPVLVAREAGSEEAVMAATDLKHRGYPVLQRASELCQQLAARLIAVHNVGPILAPVWPVGDAPLVAPLRECALESRARHLATASQQLQVRSESVITRLADPAQAILQEANTRDVGLIVVGTRPRGWLERLMRPSVSEQILRGSTRSVLVMPYALRAGGVSGSWLDASSGRAARS